MDSADRDFALEVVRQLRSAGFEALWAGGCVRDRLLGLMPKDFDVATSARPEQIRELFGFRRTLAIGASFGVITVLGRKGRETADRGPGKTQQIDVATFRADGAYLDGRHPASVTFTTAEGDAQRRDFTINGLFFDPIAEQVIDYVGGQADLQAQIVRAIGDPCARFDEDKLRMLRAIRFAATYGFAIDPATMAAIQDLAAELVIVSAERIAAELRRMLVHPRAAFAVELLRESRLLNVILPEAAAFEIDELRWQSMLTALKQLQQPTFATALAVLIRPLTHQAADPIAQAEVICQRWKLSSDETQEVQHLLKYEALILAATTVAWPQLQRVLVMSGVESLLNYCAAVAKAHDDDLSAIEYCRDKLREPADKLNPSPLLNGEDLKQLGLRPGPQFKRLLDALRDAQLECLVRTREEAIGFVTGLIP